MCKLNLHSKLFLFADDTLLLTRGENWQDVKYNAQSDLVILKKWLDQNYLSLNVSKTKFLPIALNINSDYPFESLSIHNCGNHLNSTCRCESVECVSHYKYLGVTFDCRMKWSEHILLLKNKLRKYIFAFKQLKDILNQNEIKLAYYAYIQSLLTFGNISWGGAHKSLLKPLFVSQKCILKVGFSKPRRYPTNDLFNEYALLSVRQLYIKTLLIHLFKHFNSIFVKINHSHNTRYAANTGIVTLQLRKSFSKTNPFYISHVLYRNITKFFNNCNIFESLSMSIFKIRVKKFLLELGIDRAEALISPDYGRA